MKTIPEQTELLTSLRSVANLLSDVCAASMGMGQFSRIPKRHRAQVRSNISKLIRQLAADSKKLDDLVAEGT